MLRCTMIGWARGCLFSCQVGWLGLSLLAMFHCPRFVAGHDDLIALLDRLAPFVGSFRKACLRFSLRIRFFIHLPSLASFTRSLSRNVSRRRHCSRFLILTPHRNLHVRKPHSVLMIRLMFSRRSYAHGYSYEYIYIHLYPSGTRISSTFRTFE